MRIGIIGAGDIGHALTVGFAAAGHQVMLSNSRGPDTLTGLVASIQGDVRAGTVAEAARFGEVVAVAIPLRAIRDLPMTRAVRSLAGAVIGVASAPGTPPATTPTPRTTCRSWTPAWPTWRRAYRCDRPSGAGRLLRSAGLVPATPRPGGWYCRSCRAGGGTSRAGTTR
jgi:NADP oxidoreductase coenzyme F420-dependent